MEEWKDIKGYESLYQVSNEGRVRSIRNQKLMKPKTDKKGYKVIQFSVNGERRTFKVNRLVAQAFIENPNNLPCTNHKDCNPTNNRVENLEWCDYIYNNHYANRVEKASIKMVNNPKISREVYKYTLDGDLIAKYPSANEAQRDMGINRSRGVSMCCRGIIPTYKGYKWSYKPL